MAVATNQPPIITPRNRIGATFETSDNPIGDNINSPRVRTPYAPMSQAGETLNAYGSLPVTVASPTRAAMKRMKNERPVSIMPKAIFIGVDGSSPLLSSQRQNATSGKVKTMTQPALRAREIIPEAFQSVLSFAQ